MARRGAGRLTERITFERPSRAEDGLGGQVETWAELAHVPQVWAEVRPQSGREAMMEGQVQARAIALFTVRTRLDLSEADRIVWRGVPYNIRALPSVGPRDPYMTIQAERGSAT